MKELDNKSFETAIKSANPIIVDFWAEWCMPCRALSPLLEQTEEERGNNGEFVKLNIDDYPEIAGEYSVSTIPTLIVFKDGKEVERVVGGRPKEELIDMLERNK